MSTTPKEQLTADQMKRQIRALGKQLEEPGDKDPRRIERCAEAVGLSFRKARSYWFGEICEPDPVHFNAIKRLAAGMAEAPSNEIQELRDRLDRLERALDEERARNRRPSSSESWPSLSKFGRGHSALAGQ